MSRQFAISAAVMFVLAFAFGFVIHGFILHADYTNLPAGAMRPPAAANARMPFMIVAYIAFALAFTWIYLKGREAGRSSLMQGIRYGIAIAVLTAIPTYLIYHVVTPVPLDLAIKQIVCESVVLVILGVVLAWINR